MFAAGTPGGTSWLNTVTGNGPINPLSPVLPSVQQQQGQGGIMGALGLSGGANLTGTGQLAAQNPDPTPVPVTSTDGSQPSPSDINGLITQMLGPAPSLSDFYSSAPYDQANSTLQQGTKSATDTINQAYQAAQQRQQAQQAQTNAALQQLAAQTQADRNATNQFTQATLGQAAQTAGAGSQLGARLALDQAVAANAADRGTNTVNNYMLQARNDAQSSADGLNAAQAGGLAALTAAANAESGKIGAAQANAQASGQRAFAQANASRASNFDALLGRANTYLQGLQGTGRSQALDTVAQLQSSDPGTADAFQQAVYGVTLAGQAVPGYNGPAKDQAEALQRLQQATPYLQAHGVDVARLQGLVTSYYDTTKKPVTLDDLRSYLAAALPVTAAG